MTGSKRLEYIDIAKGIGMIMVVLGHIRILPDLVYRIIFSVHMPLFFILSGYCFTFRPEEKIRTFFKKNARQLLLPYFLTSCIIVILKVIVALIQGYDILKTLEGWWLTIIYGSGARIPGQLEDLLIPIGAIWFLLALFIGRMLLKCILYSRVPWLWSLILFFAGYVTADYFWFPFSIQPGLCSVLFLYIGYAIKQGDMFDQKKIRFPVRILAAAVWVYCIINCGHLYMVECSYENGILDITGAVCGTYTIVYICQLIEKYIGILKKPLAFIGRISLGVLCAHLLVLQCWPIIRVYRWMAEITGWRKTYCNLIDIIVLTAAVTAVLYFIPRINTILFPSKRRVSGKAS